MKKTYWELLKDPRWQRVRLEVMQRDGFACTECGDASNTLNVHHAYYARGRDPWEYELESLRTLCEDCHAATTVKLAEISRLVGLQAPDVVDEILGYVRWQNTLREGLYGPDRDVAAETYEQVRGVCAGAGIVGVAIDDAVDEAAIRGGRLSLKWLMVKSLEKGERR